MKRWSVELHQSETGAWVGIVRRRPDEQRVRFMSEYHATALFAFSDCQEWLRTAETLERESTRMLEEVRKHPTAAGLPLAS